MSIFNLSRDQITAALQEIKRPKDHLVFDWIKAANLLKERDPREAYAMLKTQPVTRGCIWRKHRPVYDEYTYLCSAWDIPMLQMDGEVIECCIDQQLAPSEWQKTLLNHFVGRHHGRWDWRTKWPDSALLIVRPQDMETAMTDRQRHRKFGTGD